MLSKEEKIAHYRAYQKSGQTQTDYCDQNGFKVSSFKNWASLVPDDLEEVELQVDGMNSLALRIWDGQSPDLHLKVRVNRITKALREKDYTEEQIKQLQLPAKEYAKFI